MHAFHGSCHCGNVRVVLRTTLPPEATSPRACQCSFCRKQNTRMLSDPEGALDILVRDAGELTRYRFGLGQSEYLSCRICGVYVGSFMVDGAVEEAAAPDPTERGSARATGETGGLATLSVNVLAEEGRFPQPAPISYDGEGEDEKRERRRRRWTPARLILEG